MVHQVRVPRLSANEDEVFLADVLMSVGDWVDVGQELFSVETTKTALSVGAEASGYIRSIPVKIGSMVAVGTTLCLITDTQDESLPDLELVGGLPDEEARGRASGAPAKLTAKERLGVRRASVGATTGVAGSQRRSERVPLVEVIESQHLPWVCEARTALGEQSPGEDEVAMNVYDTLPVVETNEAYRSKGIYAGKGARLGNGSVIRAKQCYLGPGVQIGDDCHIEADSVYIGAATKIGNQTHINTGELILGEGVVIANQVLVDLSGGRSRESRLLVGHGSLIASRVLINTCREVVLEQECAVSPGAMLFTHSFWQSALEGYSVAFKGVRMCENSWVGAGCQVLPAVKIGPGSVVMSNSTVIEDVPPFSLAGGVPVKVIRNNIRRELDHGEQALILRRVLKDFVRNLEFKGCKVEGMPDTEMLLITLPDGSTRTLIFLAPDQSLPSKIPSDSILITLGKDVSASDQASVFDIVNRQFVGVEDRLTHELRIFLRRHGIRFRPFAWNPSFSQGL